MPSEEGKLESEIKEFEKNKNKQNLHKKFQIPYDQESYNPNTAISKNKNFSFYDGNNNNQSYSESNSDDYLSDEKIGYETTSRITEKNEISPNLININNININNTYVNLSFNNHENNNIFNNKDERFSGNLNLSSVIGNPNLNFINIHKENINNNYEVKQFNNNLEYNNINNAPHSLENQGLKNRKKSLKSTFKGVFNYVIGKDSKKDIEEEIEQLKILYNEMEMQIRLIKAKTILFRNKFISRLSYLFTYITGKILAFYCIYRIIMTIKNLLFLNYSDINVMLREEVLNVIDFFINIIFKLFNLDVETIYYTVLEQYFSLTIVGLIIIINIRSFLNTILFIYTKTLKKYESKTNRKLQMVFLSYFVGLFYVTSSIFLIFNLPITYR